MTLRALAAAKINLGLEVLGRRPDGFHEIRTILASVSLVDRLAARPAPSFSLHADNPALHGCDNLVARAAELIAGSPPIAIALRKRIPAAAGLGGASSDAAATLLLLDRWLALGTPLPRLATLAAELGSDVPFFLTGGVALAEGRGERLTPLPALQSAVVLVVPKIVIPRKTATLYGALNPRDFSDGSDVLAVAGAVRTGSAVSAARLRNAFTRPLFERWPALAEIPASMTAAGCAAPALSGAGPAFYSLEADRERAAYLAGRLRVQLGDDARVFTCRTTAAAVYVDLARDMDPD